MLKLTNAIIEAAIVGFEVQKKDIDASIAELRAMLSGEAPETKAASAAPKRKKLSPETIMRMRESQQKRWAKAKGTSNPEDAAPVSAKTAPKAKKRKLSAEGRKRIIEANKRMWAAKRAAVSTVPTKKAGRKKAA